MFRPEGICSLRSASFVTVQPTVFHILQTARRKVLIILVQFNAPSDLTFQVSVKHRHNKAYPWQRT